LFQSKADASAVDEEYEDDEGGDGMDEYDRGEGGAGGPVDDDFEREYLSLMQVIRGGEGGGEGGGETWSWVETSAPHADQGGDIGV